MAGLSQVAGGREGELRGDYGRVWSYGGPGYNFHPQILPAMCSDSRGKQGPLRLGWPRGPVPSSLPSSPC